MDCDPVSNDETALADPDWLLRDTDAPRAERLALRASALGHAAVADTLGGLILLPTANMTAALKALEKAATALLQDRSAQYHYALALHRAGRNEGVRPVLGAALEGNVEFAGRAEARRLLEDP